MIKIEIPNFDFFVRLDNVRDIPYNISGIYILYDKEGIPLYVGQAGCLRSRVHAHFTGHAGNNTQRHAWAFYECKAFIEIDSASKNVYECYFINFLKPPFNIHGGVYRGQNFLMKKADISNLHPAYCQHVLNEGRQCSMRPNLNGVCHLHGGNGISRQSFIDRAIEEYEKIVEVVYNTKNE